MEKSNLPLNENLLFDKHKRQNCFFFRDFCDRKTLILENWWNFILWQILNMTCKNGILYENVSYTNLMDLIEDTLKISLIKSEWFWCLFCNWRSFWIHCFINKNFLKEFLMENFNFCLFFPCKYFETWIFKSFCCQCLSWYRKKVFFLLFSYKTLLLRHSLLGSCINCVNGEPKNFSF